MARHSIKIFFESRNRQKDRNRGTLRIALSKEFPQIVVGDDAIPRTRSSRESSIGKRSHFIRHWSSTTADTLLVHPWLYSTTPRGHLIHRPMVGWLQIGGTNRRSALRLQDTCFLGNKDIRITGEIVFAMTKVDRSNGNPCAVCARQILVSTLNLHKSRLSFQLVKNLK